MATAWSEGMRSSRTRSPRAHRQHATAVDAPLRTSPRRRRRRPSGADVAVTDQHAERLRDVVLGREADVVSEAALREFPPRRAFAEQARQRPAGRLEGTASRRRLRPEPPTQALGEYAPEGATGGRPPATEDGDVTPTLPGNIVDVLVAEGDPVEAGPPVSIFEAMKMETELQAPVAGNVISVNADRGDRVTPGEALVKTRSRGARCGARNAAGRGH